jgi:hypothetical protein
MLAEMGTSSIPSLFPIPKVQSAFEDDGTPRDDAYLKRADKFLGELECYAGALKTQRERPCERSACDGQSALQGNPFASCCSARETSGPLVALPGRAGPLHCLTA